MSFNSNIGLLSLLESAHTPHRWLKCPCTSKSCKCYVKKCCRSTSAAQSSRSINAIICFSITALIIITTSRHHTTSVTEASWRTAKLAQQANSAEGRKVRATDGARAHAAGQARPGDDVIARDSSMSDCSIVRGEGCCRGWGGGERRVTPAEEVQEHQFRCMM